jgi:hypothetical protein
MYCKKISTNKDIEKNFHFDVYTKILVNLEKLFCLESILASHLIVRPSKW